MIMRKNRFILLQPPSWMFNLTCLLERLSSCLEAQGSRGSWRGHGECWRRRLWRTWPGNSWRCDTLTFNWELKICKSQLEMRKLKRDEGRGYGYDTSNVWLNVSSLKFWFFCSIHGNTVHGLHSDNRPFDLMMSGERWAGWTREFKCLVTFLNLWLPMVMALEDE